MLGLQALPRPGASGEDVAKRFGVTTRFVEQRVRLAELAPVVFAALAAGEITLGVAQAYAVTPDVDRQARVFQSMSRSYYGDNPDNVRRALLNGTVKATDAKARFVGRDAYVGAGGRIERDLFGDDADESWIDVEIIEQLAAQKLEAAAQILAAEQKLAFVTPVLATHVPYDMECQLYEYHPALRELSEDEQDRVDSLSDEGDALIRELETELEDGTPEAEAASVRLADIERELDAIEAARTMVDDAVKDQLGTFIYLALTAPRGCTAACSASAPFVRRERTANPRRRPARSRPPGSARRWSTNSRRSGGRSPCHAPTFLGRG
jgi:ParB family chromosome partitioning protein